MEVGVSPWFLGIEDIPDDETDENIAKIHADVLGKVLDAWADPLPVDDLRKWENRAGFLNLSNIVSEKRKTMDNEHTFEDVNTGVSIGVDVGVSVGVDIGVSVGIEIDIGVIRELEPGEC